MSWNSRFEERFLQRKKDTDYKREWRKRNPEKARELSNAQCRKGGKNYAKTREYKRTGIQGERELIRAKHGHKWRPFKRIIAQESVIHHGGEENSSKYAYVALVEKK